MIGEQRSLQQGRLTYMLVLQSNYLTKQPAKKQIRVEEIQTNISHMLFMLSCSRISGGPNHAMHIPAAQQDRAPLA